MKREQSQLRQLWLGAAQFLCPAGALLVTLLSPVAAQDIRGVELCTAETRMERRTACLQANVEFLHQALIKLARETQDKITAADRDLAAARAEVAALKSTTESLLQNDWHGNAGAITRAWSAARVMIEAVFCASERFPGSA
jgi:hypothetical protein